MWQLILVFMLGVIVGLFLAQIMFKPKLAGNLRIDRSDPTEEPYLFLEVTKATNLQHHYVTFKVVRQNYISQK